MQKPNADRTWVVALLLKLHLDVIAAHLDAVDVALIVLEFGAIGDGCLEQLGGKQVFLGQEQDNSRFFEPTRTATN